MSKVNYSQRDNRWKNHPYPSPSLPNATIFSGGCGPTSGAMIVASLKEYMQPDTMGDIFRQNGVRVNGGTADAAFVPFLRDRYGLKAKHSQNIDEAVEVLRKNGMAICIVKGGKLFSDGGHIIVLAGMRDDNTIIVFDPNYYTGKFNQTVAGFDRKNKVAVDDAKNIVYISIANFKAHSNMRDMYLYEDTNFAISKYKEGQIINISKKVGIAFVEDDRTMVDDGSNQFWVKSSAISGNRIIGQAIIAYAQGSTYIVSMDGYQFWIKDEDIEREIKFTGVSSVNQIRKFKAKTTLYTNSNLTGTQYNYLANTSVKILQNLNGIDKVQIVQKPDRIVYVKNNVYK